MNNLMSIPLIRDVFLTYLRRDYLSLSNDYSVTELIDCPRVVQLRKRHKQELYELPVTDEEIRSNLKSFVGTAIHDAVSKALFEFVRRYPNSGWMAERKIWDKVAGRKIVGKFDSYLNGLLMDLKTTSVWKFIYKQFKEYEEQLNIYAYLLREDKINVTVLQIIMWFTDYDANKSYQHADYPKDFIEPVIISNLWQPSVAEERIVHLVEKHKSNEEKPDDGLDECTLEDMWAKEHVYAIMAPGNKRAVRLLESEAEARDYISKSKNKEKDNWKITCRPGERTRCDKFCKVNRWCSQYKAYLAEQEDNNG